MQRGKAKTMPTSRKAAPVVKRRSGSGRKMLHRRRPSIRKRGLPSEIVQDELNQTFNDGYNAGFANGFEEGHQSAYEQRP